MLKILLIIIHLGTVAGSNYFVTPYTNPGGCYGGTVCSTQPVVTVTNILGNVMTFFMGTVDVKIYSSSEGSLSDLYLGNCTSVTDCGTKVHDHNARIPFVNGVATFSNLQFKTAASSYILQFIGYDSTNKIFGTALSFSFSVGVGPPFMMSFKTYIGAAMGGSPFAPNPVIAVVDRGNNIITNVTSPYNITAWLLQSPAGAALLPSKATTVSFLNGIATFEGLYIMLAGYPYQLGFTTNYPLPNPLLTTVIFDVSSGPPAYLDLQNITLFSSILAGEIFPLSPRVAVYDSGNNVLTYDSRSQIRARLVGVTPEVILSPAESVAVRLIRGQATFSGLSINKPGPRYFISFDLYSYSFFPHNYTYSGISILSPPFAVSSGPIRRLGVSVNASGAWAGAQPFKVQPVVEIQDYGGYGNANDFSSVAVCSMVTSLSVKRYVRIDTSAYVVLNNVTDVTLNLANGTYGVGQILIFTVLFNFEVIVNGTCTPYLQTNIVTTNGSYANASIIASSSPQAFLFFQYIVRAGDTASSVTYLGRSALVPNGCTLLDFYSNLVDFALPSPAKNYGVTITTSPPYILNVWTDAPDGEYSAGQKLIFFVQYNVPVIVRGTPYFNLSTFHSSGALYTSTLNSSVLLFVLTVQPGENTTTLSLSGASIILPGNSSILCSSDHPSTAASLNISQFASTFSSTHAITVDTTPPIVLASAGLNSTKEPGTYFAGEEIDICITFNKPIITFGSSITLALDCGLQSKPCYALIAPNQAVGTRLCFILSVPSKSNVNRLRVYNHQSLFVGPEDYLRRYSSNPTLAVNCSMATASLNSSYLNFSLNGFSATITNVTTVNPVPGEVYPDDSIQVAVLFSSSVIFTCTPVFLIDVGHIRQATYAAGSGTSTVTFNYTVSMGDSSTGLYFAPNALCTDSTCSQYSKCAVYTKSSNPVVAADLTLPAPTRYLKTFFANTTIMPSSLTRGTSLTAINCLHSGGLVSAGEEIHFEAVFTDAVFFNGTTPMLRMDTGSYSLYEKGEGTLSVIFKYVVAQGEWSNSLQPSAPNGTTSAFICNGNSVCNLINTIGGAVAINTTTISIVSNVIINTAPPRITSVSPLVYGSAPFTAGDVIPISVNFDRYVTVQGVKPWLALALGRASTLFRYAIYDENLSTNVSLVFLLTVQPWDYAYNLSCNGTDSLNFMNPNSHILAASTNALTEVNYTLPLAAISTSATVVTIDGLTIPVVTAVSAITGDGTYGPGDRIVFKVTFSTQVVANGYSYFNLKVGSHLARAIFTGTTGSANETSLRFSPSYYLFYTYTVAAGDESDDLDYADQYSLFPGLTETAGSAYIRRNSMTPTIDAILELPAPGSGGSISFSSNIVIDGSTPYVTSFDFVNGDGTFGLAENITIAMQFSGDVVVVGGHPSILLNIESYSREAVFSGMFGNDTLLFVYSPLPGDYAAYLDYFGDPSNLYSTANTFHLNGAQILAKSSAPTLSAVVHLNPPGGYITGLSSATASAGEATFANISISKPGTGYRLQFHLNATAIAAFHDIDVSLSSEYELRPKVAQPLDQVGASVAIYGQTAVVGAPNTALYSSVTTEVQTVTTSATYMPYTLLDIQLIETHIEGQPSIQQFHTTADVGAEIGGYFTIMYGYLGPSRPIPFNADPIMINAYLDFDIPDLGNVSVVKEPYTYCACANAFTWTLTFGGLLYGQAFPISFDTSLLTGSGVQIIGPTILQSPADLSGSYTLTAFGLISLPIPFNSEVQGMTNALNSLGLSVNSMDITSTAPGGIRGWIVTFAEYPGFIPQLVTNSSGLSGGKEINVWVNKLQNASYSTISGGFTLTWRGNTTVEIPYNASALQVKQALEALPVIDTVNVERCCPSAAYGFTWTVEFVQVKSYSIGGYVFDPTGPLDLMTATSYLVGTDPQVKVVEVRKGTNGEGAGVAYVYQMLEGVWKNTFLIQANDTSQSDNFGCSVSIEDDLILIGAKGASQKGRLEVQTISCVADSGVFEISFRGWSTQPIPWNVTFNVLQDYIHGDRNSLLKTPALNFITVADWGGGGLCENHTAVLTFTKQIFVNTAVYGAGSVEVELLTMVKDSLSYKLSNSSSVLTATSIQQQVIIPLSAPLAQGSAYLFRRKSICASLTNATCIEDRWIQEAEFFPLEKVGFLNFGISVAVSANIIAIGCPGANSFSGSVYIFKPNFNGIGWIYSQELSIPYVVPGDQFGYSISLNNGTLLVGAPFRNGGAGEVFAFRLYGETKFFIFVQDIALPRNMIANTNDYFGWSVGVQDDKIVIGAPGRDESAIYLGSTVNSPQTNSGAAYVYQRGSYDAGFLFLQSLAPSNTRAYDGFGNSVSINENLLVVGALEIYTGEYLPMKAIYSISTTGAYFKSTITGTFKLNWENFSTRPIIYNISAFALKTIIEQDLQTGTVAVSRSVRNVATTGYTWHVTFVGQTENVTALSADWRALLGTNVSIAITLVSPSPGEIRGKAHVFKLDTSRSLFYVEEALLSPFDHQPIDLCGYSVAVVNNYAIVGCPNRDVTLITNVNSGAAFIFDIRVLNFEYAVYSASVIEGHSLDVAVRRRASSDPTVSSAFYLETIDRNSGASFQIFIKNLYGIRDQDLIYPQTYADASGTVGTARGRMVDHLSDWIGGYYDYKAFSDYQIVSSATVFLPSQSVASIKIVTNDDTILEAPNENVTTVMFAPGLWPSTLGKLRTVTTILDNSNGYFGNTSATAYDKLYEMQPVFSAGLGTSVTVSEALGVLVTGAPSVPFNSYDHAGQVIVYRKVLGQWMQSRIIISPNPAANGRFGDEVVISYREKDSSALLAIGEPGTNTVYVFVTSTGGLFWVVEVIIKHSDAYLPQHNFGQFGTLALNNNVLVIGAPILEKAYIYYRTLAAPDTWGWSDPQVLQSSDYHYDLIFGVVYTHPQEFGRSVSISSRTIAVGSPYADYDRVGSTLIEVNIDTAGVSMQSIARGKVYIFYSQPSIQEVTLRSVIPLRHGAFKLSLNYKGFTETTAAILFSDSAQIFTAKLEALDNIDQVDVRANRMELANGNQIYKWTITFGSEWQTVPLLSVSWFGNGCPNCTAFDGLYNDSSHTAIEVVPIEGYSSFTQVTEISADDRRSGDRFGYTVALDGDQLAVGAVSSASATVTTWDFESGSLRGWYSTGNAFDYQPTFGDNTYLRAVYRQGPKEEPPSWGQRSNLQGRYFIGTYEMRPGSPSDPLVPDLQYPQGNTQGDEPEGTLTSQVFMIRGRTISFLVGGGCDDKTVYVELIVDGFGVRRVTGACRETMEPAVFNVTEYINRAAQIRIVDASRTRWGHINVDFFTFDWEVEGSMVNGTSANAAYGGLIETALSGAVYVYRRYATNDTASTCLQNAGSCYWQYQSRLVASDKRKGDLFGSSLAVNDAAGIIVVGSPFAAQTGVYKETPAAYPFANYTLFDLPVEAHLSPYIQYESTHSGVSSVWAQPLPPADNSTLLQSGAIYIFTKSSARFGPRGVIGVPDHWYPTEFAKFQPSDIASGDGFGQAIALDGALLVVGSPGQDASQINSGAAYVVDVAAAAVSFASAQFIAYEGHDEYAKVVVRRNPSGFSGDIYVDYATTDLSARGIDDFKYSQCAAMSSYQRGISGCGDYKHTRGTMFIPRGYNVSGFLVPIINNDCLQRFPRFIQVNLYVSGSGVLSGELTSAEVRIDDDDFTGMNC